MTLSPLRKSVFNRDRRKRAKYRHKHRPSMKPDDASSDADALTEKEVKRRVRTLVYRLRYCYNDALRLNSRLSGSMTIKLVIERNGHASNVMIMTGMGKRISQCVRTRILKTWDLGKVTKRIRYGPFTVRFAPGG